MDEKRLKHIDVSDIRYLGEIELAHGIYLCKTDGTGEEKIFVINKTRGDMTEKYFKNGSARLWFLEDYADITEYDIIGRIRIGSDTLPDPIVKITRYRSEQLIK